MRAVTTHILMKKKYRIKKAAKNVFSELTGIFSIQLSGTQSCIITEGLTTSLKTLGNLTGRKVIPIKKYAYHKYSGVELEQIKSVTSSCGVDQCVHPDHLVAVLHPQKSWGDY